MTEEFELTQKREEFKRQLAVGEYKTSMDVMLDGMVTSSKSSLEDQSHHHSGIVP